MMYAREAYRLLAQTHLRLMLPMRNGEQRIEVRAEIREWIQTLREVR